MKLKGQYLSYGIGFALSLVFTLNTYIATTQSQNGLTSVLLILLSGLAIMQLIVQLIFFLHLGRESKPRWSTTAFITMCMVVFFIVAGSIWIMYHLDYNMMGDHAEQMIIEDEGINRNQ